MEDETPQASHPPTVQAGPLAVSIEPNRPETVRRQSGESLRLRRMLWVFWLLLAALLAPDVAGRVQYSLSRAKERAEAEVARETLRDVSLDQISFSFRALAKAVGPSVVNIRTDRVRGEGQGSGVIVDKEGYIVTNAHVVEGAYTAEVQLSDGRRRNASLVGTDPYLDIAVLKTEVDGLIPAEWGDSDELNVGDMVWALGSPFGLDKSITFGIVSAKERRGIGRRPSIYQEFLQTDAAVNPGNSGGPLVNYQGKVVGINTAIIGNTYRGISFSIPSSLARDTYEQIRENGTVDRGYLGVEPAVVSREIARTMELEPRRGVVVLKVQGDTPADFAGMKRGDVILSWNGEEVNDPTVMSRSIAATPIGSTVDVVVKRITDDGLQEVTLQVKVAARPPFDSF